MGESFRYHIESQTITTGTTTTPIVNPEAASKLKQVADFEVRLDVVGVQPAPAANGTAGAARLRATYEGQRRDGNRRLRSRGGCSRRAIQ